MKVIYIAFVIIIFCLFFWDLTGISSLFLFLSTFLLRMSSLILDDCPTGHHIFVPMFCPLPDSAYQCVETTDGRGICNHKCHLHVVFFRVIWLPLEDALAAAGSLRVCIAWPQPGTPARGRCGNAKPAALMLGSLRAGSGNVWCSSYRQGAVLETGEVRGLCVRWLEL